jgi:hypothetical protein
MSQFALSEKALAEILFDSNVFHKTRSETGALTVAGQ